MEHIGSKMLPEVGDGDIRKPTVPSYQLDRHGTIRFNGFGHEASTNAPYAIVKSFKGVQSKGSGRGIADVRNFMRDSWKRDDPKMIISVTGGAKRFYMKQRLLDRFKRGLMRAAAATEAWIITGGTQSGVMELVGEAVRDHMLQNGSYQQHLVVLGIAVLGVVSMNQQLKDGASDARRFPVPPTTVEYNFDDETSGGKQNFLDPHHTHFMLVDDGTTKYGGEIDFRAKFEAQKSDSKNSADIPVVSLVLEGGPNTLQTAAEAIESGTAVVVFAGSGRAADFIAAACDNKDVDFGRIRSLAKKLYTEGDPQLEKKAEESITLVGRMLQKPHLLTIYRADGDNSPEIDQAILNAVLKANGMQIDKQTPDFQSWKRCAKLAVVWNHCDIARNSIFNSENRLHWQEDRSFVDEMLIDVLIHDKYEFVLLFLDSGINLKKFLTSDRLTLLYDKTLKSSGVIGGLVRNLLNRAEATYFSCGSSRENSSSHMSQNLINQVINSLTNHLYERDHVVDDCPDRELFVWAVLFNRMDMARLFWKGCRDHIGAALVASMLLESLSVVANKFEEFQLAKTLAANAQEFQQMATGVLDECYNSDQAMSHKLLVRSLDLWANRTVISLSDTGNHKDFMVHDCCQTKLTKIWFGRMAIYTPMWMIFGGLFIPFLFLPFIELDHRQDNHPPTSGGGGSKVAAVNDPEAPPRKTSAKNKNNDRNDDDDEEEDYDGGNSSSDVIVRPRTASSSCHVKITSFVRMMIDFYKAPVVKFIAHTISYLFLVGLLSYFMMIELSPYHPSIIEYIVWGWSLTMAFEMIREVYSRDETRAELKLRAYFGDMFNVMKALKYVMLLVAVILRYTLDENNFIWARNVYTITMVLFYIRILQLYYVERNLGPKVIMIRLMVRDLLFFLFLLFVFMFALGVASQTLMYPNSDPSWTVLYNVVYYPYYAVYQQYPIDQLSGQVSGCSSNYSVYSNSELKVPRCSELSWLINVLFAIYVLIIGIMLLNILIAVFSYTFNNVQEQSEKTWSFHRYSITKEYHDKPTLAPPFIIFNHAWRLLELIYLKITGQWIARNDFQLKHDSDLYKRLTAFEHAGMENYVHIKHKKDEDENEWKANATLKKLDHLTTSVDLCKEQLNKLVSSALPLERDSSKPAMREVTAAALTVALSQTPRKNESDERGHHHRCHHKRAFKSLNDRISQVERHMTSQSSKIDSLIDYITGGVRRLNGSEDDPKQDRSGSWTINVASDVDVHDDE